MMLHAVYMYMCVSSHIAASLPTHPTPKKIKYNIIIIGNQKNKKYYSIKYKLLVCGMLPAFYCFLHSLYYRGKPVYIEGVHTH